ncbi:trichoplein keratin filament-binding protein-like isoform X1 [Lucilia sericata]|uniref:trichoplein keratin filament-binding protein-like isoform X1 n=1 Tax=Lucilia sericata TaxID=13632 RepID=UPI0018A86547|nr:trichoplein keratin filament-binding protein-like isoform X1 [Lucilia sericata]XP_037824018.1 trichoplein keratin filament-binding protein-like isoform X1 [Lucilia sericata]XP_037824019.1 trichoplein keratin filament-binding protein-like isoform X1 [Lucilia sericata]XP_037824020.1 trichoplein keratin filament-binding protein-like isoform X1 [Lucilia sericata]XP_037824021.1 trichoplein keratin filament-binding protein-like isoform X1 [Lucilia sericata]XP_037824022.1 trichoplein keratin filam
MSTKSAHLQALFARRRENEHNRIERTEAVNKYYDHWGKVTARFENWTTPEYYKQAEQQLQTTQQQKEKQKNLAERQQKLSQLLEMEKKNYEQELQEKERNRNPRRSFDTTTLEKIDENLKEQQQMRRKLELEAKLYGKWRHGVDDDNLLFESKSDNEVLAKLNWLDKQVDQQLQREKEEEAAKERQIKLQHELNKTEELQKERQLIREKEIREIRYLQEYHMDQLREQQKETDDLKGKEKQLKANLNDLEKELELLEESYAFLSKAVDYGDAHNFNKIKIFIRKRSEVFRNQIKLCMSIVERSIDFAEKPQILKNFKRELEQQLEAEHQKLSQIEGMYESEAKYNLQCNEQTWQQEHKERYEKLKEMLLEEHLLIKTSLSEIMQRHEELLEIRATNLGIIENSSEKLKILIQEEENSPRYQACKSLEAAKRVEFSPRHHSTNNIIHSQLEESNDTPLYSPRRCPSVKSLELEEPHHQVDFSSRRNCYESNNNNMSPRKNDINQVSRSFANLNLDVWQSQQAHLSQRDIESQKTNAQRSLQIVTPETEAERPRFGRKRVAWN